MLRGCYQPFLQLLEENEIRMVTLLLCNQQN